MDDLKTTIKKPLFDKKKETSTRIVKSNKNLPRQKAVKNRSLNSKQLETKLNKKTSLSKKKELS